MKVLLVNGSPHEKGVTATALNEMIKIFEAEGIETELFQIGNMTLKGCVACRYCSAAGKCVTDDVVNEFAAKLEQADGMVVGTPTYYASPNGTVLSFMDRLFYSTHFDMTMKVGAAIAAARRGGQETTVDVINKYYSISGMPIASGQYWNGIHGNGKGEDALKDEEGMQMMRTLARNMAFMIKSIQLGKEAFGLPEKEKHVGTNFIR